MSRSPYVVVLLATACLIAGMYGAVHNQLSYTVSPEYFTKFKFRQFNISPDLSDRVGAAQVGWLATWWMGIVVGGILVPLALVVRGDLAYLLTTLKAILVALLTTATTGLLGLAIAWALIDSSSMRQIVVYATAIDDSASFMRAATMHNFGYLGGLLGMLTGGVTIIRAFLHDNTTMKADQSSNPQRLLDDKSKRTAR